MERERERERGREKERRGRGEREKCVYFTKLHGLQIKNKIKNNRSREGHPSDLMTEFTTVSQIKRQFSHHKDRPTLWVIF